MRRAVLAATALLALSFALSGQQRLAWPEYPEPQFERTPWVSLNGPWQLEFDDQEPKFDLAAIRDINRLLK